MSALMDMYLNSSDSISFHDALDIDIKAEIESVISGLHGFDNIISNTNDCCNEVSSFNLHEMSPLTLGDELKWLNRGSSSTNTNNDSYDFHLEDGNSNNSKMVNPNVVMPILPMSSQRSPSPSINNRSHFAFSPSSLKIAAIHNNTSKAENVKKDLTNKMTLDVGKNRISDNKKTIKTIKLATTTTTNTTNNIPILSRPTIVKTINNKTPTILTFRNAITTNQPQKQNQLIQTTSSLINNQSNNNKTTNQLINSTTNSNTIRKLNNYNNNSIITSSNKYDNNNERMYPKPAYSYSCLIAMALKNSRTGSLPVSEIYNFMCKHFPYFKTAPNGWKNSVRHNLSLNKCFEKIEKPTINGSQRKGCLWAMNPTKISKMDEEVQKWSRKDPSAIRKAMINPENLELLERGELKFVCNYDNELINDNNDLIEINPEFITTSTNNGTNIIKIINNNSNNRHLITNKISNGNLVGNNGGGDSCGGSTESEEGSDYEQEVEQNLLKRNYKFIKKYNHHSSYHINVEEDDEVEEEEEEDEDVNVGNGFISRNNEINMEFEYSNFITPKHEIEEDGDDEELEEEEEIYEDAEDHDDENNTSDLDIEVGSNEFDVEVINNSLNYDGMSDEDEEQLRMEVALAHKELFDYGKPNNKKKRRTFIIHN